FSLSEVPPWLRVGELPRLRVANQFLATDRSTLSATIYNDSINDASGVVVAAVLFDASGTARAASRSLIARIAHKSQQDVIFIWQSIWIFIGVAVFFGASHIDWRFLRRSGVAAALFGATLVPLVFLVLAGHATQGAKSWFDLGGFVLQPVEFVKLALIIALAK